MTTEEIPKNNRKSRPVSVALTPAEREFIKAYGDGNVSRGIRAMVRVCRHLQDEAALSYVKRKTPKTHTGALAGGPELCTQAELDEALAGATYVPGDSDEPA